MIEGLQPYSDYRDSSAPWFGYVPAHWKVKRLGSVFGERGETNERREVTEILSVLKDRGVILYTEKGRIGNKASDDIGRYKIVRPDDLVVNCMNVIIGSLGRSRYTGCLSPVYYVLRRRDPNHDPRYLELVFQHKPFHESLIRIGNGILAHRMRIPMEKLKAEMFPLPPLDEQAAIVRFLDHANRKIDGFIRAKRKLIGLLNEQKQAIIHRAVTRGLDPNVKLKDSGIPWLGDIPEHWELWPNRAFLRIRKVLVGGRHTEFTLLSLTKRGVIVRDLSEMRGKFSSDMGTSQEVRDGDLVLCLFDVPETPRTVGLSKHDGMITGAYTVMECKDRGIAEYLELFYIAMDDHKALSPLYSGLRNTIPKASFLGVKTPVPPSHERAAILQAVKNDAKSLDLTISRTEREIALMQEYRTRLTADVVTGKLDVRAAAEELPALADQFQTALDESSENEEVEEEG